MLRTQLLHNILGKQCRAKTHIWLIYKSVIQLSEFAVRSQSAFNIKYQVDNFSVIYFYIQYMFIFWFFLVYGKSVEFGHASSHHKHDYAILYSQLTALFQFQVLNY